ncbi:MAG TPA: hypothetical protein VIL85_08870 [Thermomicrobiales bacterium]|jgi:hypothetical protein
MAERHFDAWTNEWQDDGLPNELSDGHPHMVYHEAAPDIATARPGYPVRLTEAEMDALLDRTAPGDDAQDGPPIYFVTLTEFEIERLLARTEE